MLRMNNLQTGRIDTNNLVYVDLSDEEFEKFALKAGDLLVNRTNSYDLVGKTALFELEDEYVFASYLVRFRLDTNKAFPQFINYYFNSYAAKRRLQAIATKGVSQANINPTILKERFLVPLPPLPEQRRIAEILGTWDQTITLTEQLIAAKQRRKKALMQQLLTGRRRFREFEGEEWREVHLGEGFAERRETGFVDLPLLSVTDEKGIVYRDTLDRRDTSNEDKSKYLHVCPGDIAYNTMRMWQGRAGVSKLEGIVSPAYTVCVPKASVDVNFMGYLFKFPPTIYVFWRFSQGLVSDTLSLKFDAFSRIRVKNPGIEEQRKIAAVLQACDEEIELLGQKLAALKRQKQGLMQQLLTGRVRVKPSP